MADVNGNSAEQTATIEKSSPINEKQKTNQINNTYSSYKPAVFTDEHRLEKIQQALPAIEQLFREKFEANQFPGLIYGIVVDGELLDAHSFGYTNLEQKIPVTTKSLFRIASMTKSFTAMAIVKLRDDGKVRLDDPVHQYIPILRMTDVLTIDAPIITIRHLLTQDAGMPEDDPWADRQLALPDAEFLAVLSKGIGMSNPPGTIWEYCNLCYALLGKIITLVSQISYQEYIKQEILDPLGMANTFWEYTQVPPELLAHGYRWECEQYVEESLLGDGAYGAMGGLISSIEDFSKYISYHLQAWPARNEPEYGPLKRSSLREIHHPSNFIELSSYVHRPCSVTNAYCYGLIWSKNSDGIVSVNHTGGLPGFGSNWVILPEHGIGLVSFANRTYAKMDLINTSIIDATVTLADLKQRQLPVSKILSERKEQIIKLILYNNWNINDPQVSAIFAENFFSDQSLELRKIASEELLKQAVGIRNIGELIPKNQLRGHFEIEGEEGKIKVSFSLSPENPPLIQELTLSEIKLFKT
jgi:CubicO group peptidase (beta-lactamase class C family)